MTTYTPEFNLLAFKSLKEGDMFQHGGDLLIKIHQPSCVSESNAFFLHARKGVWFGGDVMVQPATSVIVKFN